MKFHAFLYGVVGRRHELERGMAGKDPVLFQRMLDEIGAYARLCDEAGYAGIGLPEHHLQIEGFEAAQEPGLLALYLGLRTPRLNELAIRARGDRRRAPSAAPRRATPRSRRPW